MTAASRFYHIPSRPQYYARYYTAFDDDASASPVDFISADIDAADRISVFGERLFTSLAATTYFISILPAMPPALPA